MSSCFISHSHNDKDIVLRVFKLLTSLGIDCFVDKRSISIGEAWPESLARGLDNCEWFLLVASSSAARSEWIKDEVAWALENRRNRIIIVAIDETQPSEISIGLSRIQFIDYKSNTEEAQNILIQTLVDSIYKPNRRSNCVEGKWEIQVKQHDGPFGESIEYAGELFIEYRNNAYEGKMILFIPNLLVERLKLPFDKIMFLINGGFNLDRFVSISYSSRDPGFIQFGSFILELHSMPNTMAGKFIGFGAFSSKIISGDVSCKKA